MKVEHAVEEGLSAVWANIFHHSKSTMTSAFLASLRENGFEIVSVEATPAMIEAGRFPAEWFYGPKAIWKAMLAAATENDDGR